LNDRSLAKLNRNELLDLLYEQQKQIEELQLKNEELTKALNDRQIRLSKVGSIAEASLALSSVFKEAQKAADLYLENVQGIVREKKFSEHVFPSVRKPEPKEETPAPAPVVEPQPVEKKPEYVGRHSKKTRSGVKR